LLGTVTIVGHLTIYPFYRHSLLEIGELDINYNFHSKFTCDSPPVNLSSPNSRGGAKINIV